MRHDAYQNGSTTETTLYIGGLLEKVDTAGVTDWRHYVIADGEAVAIVSRPSVGANATRYLLKDHLGSVAKILDQSGAEYVRQSFSAFGVRRDPNTWSGPCPCPDLDKIRSVSRRGYTEHEMIGGQSMGLIHMNGRVQDALTGRFLSPDPFVQAPFNGQSLNRYSYVFNNPLSYVDPSGFRCQDLPDGESCPQGDIGGDYYEPSGDPQFTMNGLGGRFSTITSVDESAVQRMSIEEYGEHTRRHIADLEALLAMGDGTDALPRPEPYTTLDGAIELIDRTTAISGPAGFVVKQGLKRAATRVITSRLLGRAGRATFGETTFRGLVQNRQLTELTDTQVRAAFRGTPFTPSDHAVMRLLDSRTKSLGYGTLNDVAVLLNKGVVNNAGGGVVAIQLGRFEAIIDPITRTIVTFRPF